MPSVIDHFFQGNPNDCREKLANCVAKFRGQWGYLGRYLAATQAAFNPLGCPRDAQEIVDLSKVTVDEFEVGPYNLGMVNFPDIVLFTSRDPQRKNRLGLREDNLASRIVWSDSHDASDRLINNMWTKLLFDAEAPLYQTLRRNYPKYSAVLNSIYKGDTTAQAFSPHFAAVRVTSKAAHLFYKADVVGEIDLLNGEITLYPSFAHLQQRAESFARVKVM